MILKNYYFTGMQHEALPIPKSIQIFLDIANKDNYGYNGVLINWYKDGSHYIGPHSDNTDSLSGENV